MAIMPHAPGFKAEILVGGLPLKEYTDEDDEDANSPTNVTRYVECVSGASFAIHYSITPDLHPNHCLSVEIHLDGKFADSAVHSQAYRAAHPAHPASFYGARIVQDGAWKEKAFHFADIVTTEGGAGVKPSAELGHLGSISIRVRRVQELAIYDDAQLSRSLETELKPIPEKHLKGQALSHQVKLGQARNISVPRFVSVRCLDPEPIWTIQFRYRSRPSLQALCMIPRSPTPVSLEDRPREELTREELLELLRRQERNHEKQTKVKREPKRERTEDEDDSSGDDNGVSVSSKRPKVIETVDLTDA